MDSVFKYFNGFFKGLTGLVLTVLALGIVAQITFGMGEGASGFFGIDVIGNVMTVIDGLAGGGFAVVCEAGLGVAMAISLSCG